jgi:hypothetical protein
VASRCAAALQQGALQQAADHAATARRAFDWVSCTATTAAAAAAACSASAAAAAAATASGDTHARGHSSTAAAAAAAAASASTTGDSASLATITTHANSSAAGDAPECLTAANGRSDNDYSREQLPPEQAPAARAALKRVLRLAAQGAVSKKSVTKKGVIRVGASLGLNELRHRAESLLEEMEDVEDEIVQVRTSRTFSKTSENFLYGTFFLESYCSYITVRAFIKVFACGCMCS